MIVHVQGLGGPLGGLAASTMLVPVGGLATGVGLVGALVSKKHRTGFLITAGVGAAAAIAGVVMTAKQGFDMVEQAA